MILQDAIYLFCRLGIGSPLDLTPDEFDRAYRQLAKRYHPDVNPNTGELMANINAARNIIIKQKKRLHDQAA